MSFPNSCNGPFSASFKWKMWSAKPDELLALHIFRLARHSNGRCGVQVIHQVLLKIVFSENNEIADSCSTEMSLC